ncbi:MAG TPA: HD domain-containing phosphohydrolase [Bryobacteraceae bacterium]|nr:HD domain-containing phosphohydrolase [Bryobacteraceae bacterium]
MRNLPSGAKVWIGLVTLAGVFAAWRSLALSVDGLLAPRFLCVLALALLSSGFKVKLPGVTTTISISFLFILTSILELGLPQTMVVGLGSALVQIFWNARKRPVLYQVVFNLAVIAVSVRVADLTFHSFLAQMLGGSLAVKLLLATVAYFALNSLPVACAISMIDGKPLTAVWKECYFWSFPYYLLNATIVCIVHWVMVNLGWEFSLLVIPVAWVMYRSYSLYIGRLETEKERVEQEKVHVEQINALHLRTIETLALAIEAKDHTTHEHLRRVQHYSVEIGKEMGLTDEELNALRAASLLHDIGKLAVPEHIITKPGKLTPQEFEKMKIHPVVGAEILEQVNFPYPVAPIVRAHHEKWNGSGYPLGLAGEDIPLGARILAAVDCFDALASDRQYRRAVPLDEAMAVVIGETGKSYDPQVVEVLARRYRELEEEALRLNKHAAKLSIDARIERGKAPDTGFESPAVDDPGDFRTRIAAAGREAQYTMELVSDLGNSLGMAEMLAVLSSRLTLLIPADSIAVYECKNELLRPVYVDGRDRILFSSLQIPLGEGLSGWVAKHNKPILNGNPNVEPGYLNDPSKFSLLRSALSVPLAGLENIVGVLTLYRAGPDAFGPDDLRILAGLSSKIGVSFENSLKYRALEASATTDYLTGLNNTGALFERLNHELSRCEREKTPLTVIICDLDQFKQVNDRFGHNAGNEVLRMFAKGLAKICRKYDVTARLGGDEFVMVLPGLKAGALGEKIVALSALATEAGRTVCGEEIISASVGLASWPEDGLTADELIGEADRRMYADKSGRKQKRPYARPAYEPKVAVH